MNDDYNGLEWIGAATLLILAVATVFLTIYGANCLAWGC